jgi:hypothetical protein
VGRFLNLNVFSNTVGSLRDSFFFLEVGEMPKKKRKKKRVKRLDDIRKWKAESLAKFGGFSHRFIASLVFEKTMGRVTVKEVACISSFLSRSGIKVSDWRNGNTVQASRYAKDQVRPKKERERRKILGLTRRAA